MSALTNTTEDETCCDTLVERMAAAGEELIAPAHYSTRTVKLGEVLVDCDDSVWTVIGHEDDGAGEAILEHDGERMSFSDMGGLAPFAHLTSAADAEIRGVEVRSAPIAAGGRPKGRHARVLGRRPF